MQGTFCDACAELERLTPAIGSVRAVFAAAGQDTHSIKFDHCGFESCRKRAAMLAADHVKFIAENS